ncbi:MAG: hypothetical protein DMG06_21950 [Acidobacteria bacterium]|nr:MAG: hypothetical protein DMG06_21950 [Acidobacteriota bacterium]
MAKRPSAPNKAQEQSTQSVSELRCLSLGSPFPCAGLAFLRVLCAFAVRFFLGPFSELPSSMGFLFPLVCSSLRPSRLRG